MTEKGLTSNNACKPFLMFLGTVGFEPTTSTVSKKRALISNCLHRRRLIFEGFFCRGKIFCNGAGEKLESHVELDQHSLQLFVGVTVTGQLGLSGLDLVVKADCTHHRLFKIRTIDRDGQVRIFRLESLDVGERAIAQLDNKLLVVIGCHQVNDEIFDSINALKKVGSKISGG